MKRTGIILLLALLAWQCRKDEKPVTPLPAGLKAYAYFQPGTYWIYQDSATGRRDSVWVTSARTWVHTTKDRNRIYGHNEDMEVRMASNVLGEREYKTHCTCPSIPDSSAFVADIKDVLPCWLVDEYWVSNGSSGSSQVFAYSLRPEQPELGGHAYRYLTPQRLASGRTFAQVVTLAFMTTDGAISSVPARYWWAKGLGVVQQRLYLPSGVRTRTLVRERIVQ